MLNVVSYIKTHSLEKLISDFSLRVNRHCVYPQLVQLCYHQLDTPKNDITDNCRGLILDESDNYRVVSFPFTRFSEYNEKKCQVDFSTVSFYEKLDGSLISMYYYDNNWHVSTKGLPDASGLIKDIDKSYHEYFWEVFNTLGYNLPKEKQCTYIFKFRIPTQNFLTQCSDPDIVLIGIRDNETFEEHSIESVLNNGWKTPRKYDLPLRSILELVNNSDPIILEGVVAVDAKFNRVKIKNPQHEAINGIRQNTYENQDEWQKRQNIIKRDNYRRMFEIVRTN